MQGLISETDRYGITYLKDRDPDPGDYNGLPVEVVHMDTLNRQNSGHRARLVEKRLKKLTKEHVSLSKVGKDQSLDENLDDLKEGEPRILAGVVEQGCVLVRARVIARKGGTPIIDRALTIKDYGR